MDNLNNVDESTKRLHYNDELMIEIENTIEYGNSALKHFSEYVDTSISEGYRISRMFSNVYFSALSELAKAYSNFDYNRSIGQLTNYSVLVKISGLVLKGLEEERKTTKLYNDEYEEIMKNDYNPANNPLSHEEHMGHINELARKYGVKFADCMTKVVPQSLLQQETKTPFILNDGTEYKTVMECVDNAYETQNNTEKVDVSTSKK